MHAVQDSECTATVATLNWSLCRHVLPSHLLRQPAELNPHNTYNQRTKRISIPTTHITNVLSAKRNSIPTTHINNVLSGKRNSIPTTHITNVLSADLRTKNNVLRTLFQAMDKKTTQPTKT